jgi:hypothetical protein
MDVADTTTTVLALFGASSMGAQFHRLLVLPSGLHAHAEAALQEGS